MVSRKRRSAVAWRVKVALLAASALAGLLVQPAAADTLESALIQSYQNNPQLNAQRAAARVTD